MSSGLRARDDVNGRIVLIRTVIVCLASLIMGAIESWAQGLLPDPLKPLANSASGWTLVTIVLIFWSRLKPPYAAPLAALSFVLLVLGYAVMSGWRGTPYSPNMWVMVGLVVGPCVGVATAWLRESHLRLACGVGVISGILIGEGIYGLTTVQATTGLTYWILITVAGFGLIPLALLKRRLSGGDVGVMLGTLVVVAGGLYMVFRYL